LYDEYGSSRVITMSKSLNIIWQYLRAFVLIYACLYAGIFIASLLPITIPAASSAC
jgi:holin-like protein